MIRLRVEEKTYEANSTWAEMLEDEFSSLILSTDAHSKTVPTISKGLIHKAKYFVTDYSVMAYYVEIVDSPNVDYREFMDQLDRLTELSFFDSAKLRRWFKDIPTGQYILELGWKESNEKGFREMTFNGWHPDTDPDRVGLC